MTPLATKVPLYYLTKENETPLPPTHIIKIVAYTTTPNRQHHVNEVIVYYFLCIATYL